MIKWIHKEPNLERWLTVAAVCAIVISGVGLYKQKQTIKYLELLNSESLAEARYHQLKASPCTIIDRDGAAFRVNCSDLEVGFLGDKQ